MTWRLGNAKSLLFPIRSTVRRLELEQRWWHRLAVVFFFVALVPILLSSSVLGYDMCEPEHDYIQEIHYWGGGGPNGFLFDLNSYQPLDNTAPAAPRPPTVQKTIEMPDGKTEWFPGSTSDDAINAEWNRRSNRANVKAFSLGFGIAVVLTLIFGYFLQGCYRLLLYVIYGAKARNASDTTASS